jgi:hypothetical protein
VPKSTLRLLSRHARNAAADQPETWLSGRKRLTANEVGLKALQGSNPCVSASRKDIRNQKKRVKKARDAKSLKKRDSPI